MLLPLTQFNGEGSGELREFQHVFEAELIRNVNAAAGISVRRLQKRTKDVLVARMNIRIRFLKFALY